MFHLRPPAPVAPSGSDPALTQPPDPAVCTCPLCRGETRRLFARGGYWIRRCRRCGHLYAEIVPDAHHVARVYDDLYFQGGGAGYSDYLGEAPLLRNRGRWYGRLLRRYTPSGTVLDVGAAAGFLLQGLVDSGWRGRGIEPNARMAEYARSQLGLAVDTGTLEEWPTAERFDLVSLIQVVPHFVDPRRALARAAALTQDGGHWLIETWTRQSWTARTFGRHWHEYSPPSVLHWFSPAGLAQLAGEFGLHSVARGRPAKWLDGQHAKGLLRHHLGGSWFGRGPVALAGFIPDRLPIPYPAEDLFWSLFRKS